MIEQKGFEPRPIPNELHQQLGSLYYALPKDGPGDWTRDLMGDFVEIEKVMINESLTEERLNQIIDHIINRTDQRRDSETKQKLIKKYSTLLQYSLTTNPCKEYLLDSYNKNYIGGFNQFNFEKEPDHIPPVAAILRINEEDIGGIFDTNTSPEIEKNLYHFALDMHTVVAGEYSQEQMENLIKRETPSGKMTVILKKWRNEYIDKYQDEP